MIEIKEIKGLKIQFPKIKWWQILIMVIVVTSLFEGYHLELIELIGKLVPKLLA